MERRVGGSSVRALQEWLKEVPFVRWIGVALLGSYGRYWSAQAVNERSAMKAILTDLEREEDFGRRGQEFAERLRPHIRPGDVVLDLGCGIGRVEVFLASFCREVHGVDVSRRMITLARRRLKNVPNVYFHWNDGRGLGDFHDASFDFLFSVYTLMHLEREDAVRYLLEFHRVLRPGGRAYLQFPNLLHDPYFGSFLSSVKRYRQRGVGRVRYYTEPEVRKVLEGTGFTVASVEVDSEIWALVTKGQGGPDTRESLPGPRSRSPREGSHETGDWTKCSQ